MNDIDEKSNKNLSMDKETLNFYSDVVPVYIGSGNDGISRHLNSFLNLLEPKSHILELGCGGGRDAEAMLQAGFEVTPTDGTPEIAQQAEKRLGRFVRVMRFDELDDVDAYDAVWANASLLHVPRDGLGHVLTLIFKSLKKGGRHFASYKGGGREGRDDDGRYFNYLTKDQLIKIYSEAAAWKIETVSEYEGGGYPQGKGPWVGITVQKL